MGYINITCQCGHVADLADFCRVPLFGELPPGQFQCPKCMTAWKRRESEHRILRSGSEAIIIPGRVEVLMVDSRL